MRSEQERLDRMDVSRFPECSLPEMNRREFLVNGTAALACTAVAAQSIALAQSAAKRSVEVETTCGRIRGLQTDGLATFKGIPYAGSVAGANRFKAAPPLQPWTGVRDALQVGAPSMQPGRGRNNEPPYAEDCLFLNIWTPAADGRKRPVMLYNHGGGFVTGSGAASYQ